MRTMKAMLKVTAASLALLFALGGVAGAGTQLRTRDRDKLRDGSCQIAASQYRYQERSRLRDGSRRIGGDQLRQQLRDRLRDGSCRLG